MTIHNNKVALITGVSRTKSIGFGIAKQLAQKGYSLFLHSFASYDELMQNDLPPDELEIVLKELNKYSINIGHLDVDFEVKGSTHRLFEIALKKFGHMQFSSFDTSVFLHLHKTYLSVLLFFLCGFLATFADSALMLKYEFSGWTKIIY